MQRRMLAAVFAAALVLPVSAAAQSGPAEEVVLIGGMRVSPFVGFLTPFNRAEEWIYEEGDEFDFERTEVEVSGGTAFGVQVEAPLTGRFGWLGAAGYAARGDTDFFGLHRSVGYRIDGNHVFFLRAGAALYLHEADSELVLQRLNASLFAGAVAMHERPRGIAGDFLSSGTHKGLNVGMNAEIPFGSDRFAVQVGVEDNMMWWDGDQLRSLAYVYFGGPGTTVESTTATGDMAHAWLMRAGLQFRF